MHIERRPGFPPPGGPGLFWLGQAGFWLETGQHRILIDPYLSDSLAKKYAGTANDHRRMMPPPILVGNLPRPDLILITHAHTDHMDPETLRPLVARFPDVPVVVPRARMSIARDRVGETARLLGADAGDTLVPVEGIDIMVFPAAHETLERDTDGWHVFLGYGISAGGFRLYHSGDTVPFDGLTEAVLEFRPDVALLPVNGRDAARLAAGIPGNLTLAEAITLAEAVDAAVLVPHHFGMFAFNTADEAEIDAATRATSAVRIVKPVAGERLSLIAREQSEQYLERTDITCRLVDHRCLRARIRKHGQR